MSEHRKYNLLFLCTGNSARSIMAEAAANHPVIGQDKLQAYSAGSFPTGRVHPMALATLERHGIAHPGARSKSWDEFAQDGGPDMDFVITVCDQAAGETCPIWPGQPMQAHWGVPDPAGLDSDEVTVARAFEDAFQVLKRRIELFVALPWDKLDRLAIHREVRAIGQK